MSGYFPDAETVQNEVVLIPNKELTKFRDWFRAAVDKSKNWREAAHEDYGFVTGEGQWSKEDKEKLAESGRPALTINKIKPLMNVLSGYQRLNRYDIDFLPRTSDDQNLCDVRKGMTKYVMDECDYEYVESQVFMDGAISGIGWFEVKYQFDYLTGDGEAKITRESPFNIYVDPESREQDFSDAKYLIRAKWTDKEELKNVYPEYAQQIDAQTDILDEDEQDGNYLGAEPLWYQKETKKLRLIECWYKKREQETIYELVDGRMIPQGEFKANMIGMVAGHTTVPIEKIKVCIFFDNVLLENIDSPYKHHEFPFVPFCVYNFGEGDLPAGVVRDLKDPQRELNKRRSQEMHILNTTAYNGWMSEDGAFSPDQERILKKLGSRPGVHIKTLPGAMTGGKIRRLESPAPPAALLQAGSQAERDIPAISGINEALMGVDIPNSASGRAIELKQKQAITHIAPMFDNLRRAKKKIAYLLWGKRGRQGIIPQYYTESKCYRITGKNGQQEFINVNQPAAVNDPLRGVIHTTLNDLSQGEFDIIIADTQASATQRSAQFWSLVDAVGKLGIQGDMVFDILLDLSDIPNKEEIKQRFQQRQQQQQTQQQQQAQAQAELARMQLQEKALARITYKDAIAPVRMLIDAKAGVYGNQSAAVEQAAMVMLQQLYGPLLQIAGEAQPQIPQEAGQAEQLQAIAQLLGGQPQQQTQQPQPSTLTDAAAHSLMAGQGPAI